MYENAGLDFTAIFWDHLENGMVISSPFWFLMLRTEEWRGKTTWFVECAIGDLKTLAKVIALRFPQIGFCRVKNGKKQTKIYSTDRLLKLATRDIAIR